MDKNPGPTATETREFNSLVESEEKAGMYQRLRDEYLSGREVISRLRTQLAWFDKQKGSNIFQDERFLRLLSACEVLQSQMRPFPHSRRFSFDPPWRKAFDSFKRFVALLMSELGHHESQTYVWSFEVYKPSDKTCPVCGSSHGGSGVTCSRSCQAKASAGVRAAARLATRNRRKQALKERLTERLAS